MKIVKKEELKIDGSIFKKDSIVEYLKNITHLKFKDKDWFNRNKQKHLGVDSVKVPFLFTEEMRDAFGLNLEISNFKFREDLYRNTFNFREDLYRTTCEIYTDDKSFKYRYSLEMFELPNINVDILKYDYI